MIIEFTADKISFRGPTVDGGYKMVIDVGEYEAKMIAELIKIPQQTMLKIKIEYDE